MNHRNLLGPSTNWRKISHPYSKIRPQCCLVVTKSCQQSERGINEPRKEGHLDAEWWGRLHSRSLESCISLWCPHVLCLDDSDARSTRKSWASGWQRSTSIVGYRSSNDDFNSLPCNTGTDKDHGLQGEHSMRHLSWQPSTWVTWVCLHVQAPQRFFSLCFVLLVIWNHHW